MAADDRLHRTVSERLGVAGQLYTRGRRALVDALAGAGAPRTLPDLLSATPTVTQSSAYRNLSLMEEAGVVRRIVTGSDHAHFELAEDLAGHHHHVICTTCGTVRDFVLAVDVEKLLGAAFDAAARTAGLEPTHHDIDLYGVCRDCQARESGSI